MCFHRAATLAVTVLTAGAFLIGSADQIQAKDLGPVKGPNGLPWSLSLRCTPIGVGANINVSTEGLYLQEESEGWVKLAAQPSSPKGVLRAWKLYHRDGRKGLLELFDAPVQSENRQYPYRFELTLDYALTNGGCDRFPDGSRPASVVSESASARAKPSPKAAITATLSTSDYVWKVQAADSGKWVPVFVETPGTPELTVTKAWIDVDAIAPLR